MLIVAALILSWIVSVVLIVATITTKMTMDVANKTRFFLRKRKIQCIRELYIVISCFLFPLLVFLLRCVALHCVTTIDDVTYFLVFIISHRSMIPIPYRHQNNDGITTIIEIEQQ